MSRNADEGINVYFDLFNKGVSLVFLKEQYINTSKYQEAINKHLDININTGKKSTDKYFKAQIQAIDELLKDLQREDIIIAFNQAQKEVDDLRQRTKEGIETARLNGKQIGNIKGVKFETKKSIMAKEQILKHSKSFGGDLNDIECMKMIGISKPSYYKYKRELAQNN